MNRIPQFLTNYNIYGKINGKQQKLIGTSGDITLPKFENIGDTVSGAGLLGEFETPVPGAFKSQTLEVNFRIIDKTLFQIAAAANNSALTFRGSQQITDYSNGGVINQSVRIETRGGIKGFDLGKATPGKSTDSKLIQEIIYIAIYIDNYCELELDKLNYKFRLHGADITGGVLKNI